MLKYLFAAFLISICLIVGKALAHYIGFFPGSIYGMLLFAAILASNIFDEAAIGAAIAKIINIMPLVFLPVCVGVIQYGDLLQTSGWKIVAVGMSSTLSVMALVAFICAKILRDERCD